MTPGNKLILPLQMPTLIHHFKLIFFFAALVISEDINMASAATAQIPEINPYSFFQFKIFIIL